MTASALPETMRVSVLREAGQLELADWPVPRPGPGQVLVAVRSVGVCGSDVHYFQHGRIGDFVVRRPLVLGRRRRPGGVAGRDRAGRRVRGVR
jgi:L-iditol 2-dehydrogenase